MSEYEDLQQKLESAREAMHASRSPENVAAYNEASTAFANARQQARQNREAGMASELDGSVSSSGDVVIDAGTVEGGTGVNQ